MALLEVIRKVAIEENQEKGYHVYARNGTIPPGVNDVEFKAGLIKGNNLFPVKLLNKKIRTVPEFNFPPDNSVGINISTCYSMMNDDVMWGGCNGAPHSFSLYKKHPKEAKQTIRRIFKWGKPDEKLKERLLATLSPGGTPWPDVLVDHALSNVQNESFTAATSWLRANWQNDKYTKPLLVFPPPRIIDIPVRPRGVPSLQYLCVRKLLDTNPDKDPFYIAEHSFVTGQSEKGFIDALSKMSREETKPVDVSDADLATAILRVMAKQKIHKKMDPLPPTDEAIRLLRPGSSTSAGYNLHHKQFKEDLNGIIVEGVMSFKKNQGEIMTKLTCLVILERIADRVRKCERDGVKYQYDPADFDPVVVVSKMSIKAEGKPPGDKEKQRIIFVTCFVKLILDMWLYGPSMHRKYNIGANGIGTKWAHGGAQRFADKCMGVMEKGIPYDATDPKKQCGFISLDISKFDQSVLACLLMIVLFLPYFMVEKPPPEGHPNYNSERANVFKVFCSVLQWSITNSVAKIVKWVGEDWMVVWGLMFSGEYETSMGDSEYLEIVFECFDIYMARIGPWKQGEFARMARRFKDYGDDGLLKYALVVIEHICKGSKNDAEAKQLAFYLKHHWHMDLKLSDTYVCKDTDKRPDMSLPSIFTQLQYGGWPGDECSYRGAKYLRRYLIWSSYKGRNQVLPWRPTADYFTKAICIAGNNQSEIYHLVRLRALALDTMGTNRRAYNFLRDCHTTLLRCMGTDPENLKKIGQEVYNVINNISVGNMAGFSTQDKNLIDRVGGREGAQLITMGFPKIEDILERFSYDSEIQEELDKEFSGRASKGSWIHMFENKKYLHTNKA